MQVRIETAAARRALSNLNAGIRQATSLAMRAAVSAALYAAKATKLWKDRRPLTRNTIHGEAHDLTGFVEAGGASHFLEYGTAAHVIMARGTALRFSVNGRVLYRKWVNHPGTKPRPFMHEAAARGQQALDYGIEEYINYAISRARG
jgi:hypothetical protein